jgi:hypothetical protein
MYYIVKEQYYCIVDDQDVCYGYYATLVDAKRKLRHLLLMDNMHIPEDMRRGWHI